MSSQEQIENMGLGVNKLVSDAVLIAAFRKFMDGSAISDKDTETAFIFAAAFKAGVEATIEALKTQEPVMWVTGLSVSGKPVEAGLIETELPLFLHPAPILSDMVMVPKEPTEAMIDAVIDERMNAFITGNDHTFIDIYRAMVTTAEKEQMMNRNAPDRIATLKAENAALRDQLQTFAAALVVKDEVLESARNGLVWYREEFPEVASEADHEQMQLMDKALAVKPHNGLVAKIKARTIRELTEVISTSCMYSGRILVATLNQIADGVEREENNEYGQKICS